MDRIIYYGILAVVVFIILAWNSDIKPRIFSNPDAVKLRPEFSLGFLIYLACFFVAFVSYWALLIILPDSKPLRIALGITFFLIAVFLGNLLLKRSLRRIFYDYSISLRMNPEEYARTICPSYIVQYIDSHLHDKKSLEQYIKSQRKLRHISDQCAWAFLVGYCDKDPNSL